MAALHDFVYLKDQKKSSGKDVGLHFFIVRMSGNIT